VNASLVTVTIDAAAWAGWGTAVGYGAHRLPRVVVARDSWLTRPRGWERDGRWYERIGVRRWKRLLPDAGTVFPGGVSKRRLVSADVDALRRLAEETRRAELVHWAVPALAPVFALWNPAPLTLAMIVYAVVANAPCLIVQRYNRARLLRVIGRSRPREMVVA
jgi:glycosyl-4,4'-diaponeurosporenoate acyltransferase